jgi:hypothetical protein
MARGHRKSGRDGSLTNSVAVARPVLQDVDVQVLGMRRIGPWAEYRCEPPACGDADGIDRATQMFIPIRFDGQCFAIRELEARDVYRQTGRVRADLAGLCVVAVAAFVTRSRVDRLEFDSRWHEASVSTGSLRCANPQGKSEVYFAASMMRRKAGKTSDRDMKVNSNDRWRRSNRKRCGRHFCRR